jgi:hypothetical protein
MYLTRQITDSRYSCVETQVKLSPLRYLLLSYYSCTGDTSEHLLKYSQYILVRVTPPGKTGPVWTSDGEGCQERAKEGKYGGNNMYSCIKMEQ